MGGAITGAITGVLVGIVCFVIGILNIKGNISMLHSYHINNIKEEDRIPFGKLVGKGMIVIAIALVIYGILFIPFELTQNVIYTYVSNCILIVGLVIGLAITLYAIKKYNKKIIG